MKRESLNQHFCDKEYEITLFYDRWLRPNSTEKEQIKVGPIASKELLKEYGNFLYEGAYTAGFNKDGTPAIDVWAIATPDMAYKYPQDLNAYVKICRGEKTYLEPVEDYLDRESYKYGFDSYEELRKEGYSIDLPALYNKDGELLEDTDIER